MVLLIYQILLISSILFFHDDGFVTLKTLINILCLSMLWFSCEELTQDIYGCLDSEACNYDSNANINNNSCIYEEDCNGECGGTAVWYLCWDSSLVCGLSNCPTFNSIDIYDIWKQNTNLDPDTSGYYHFTYIPTGNYSNSDYGTVKYSNEIPVTRTFWESPDSFWVFHQNQWIGTPIIDNSTYSDDDGYGQQLFYIYEPFIGDTLSIYGYICHENTFGDCSSNYLVKDSVFVIIE